MSDPTELTEPTDSNDTTNDTPGIQADIRPLNAPRPGALVERNNFTVRGPDYHSPNDETVKLHLYVFSQGSNRFVGEKLLWLIPNVVPFVTQFTMSMPAWVPDRARAYLHYQFRLKSGIESDWYDSDWFEIATPPNIKSHVSGQTQDVARPVLSGTAPGLSGLRVRAVKQVSPSSTIFLSNVGSVDSNLAWTLPLTQDLVDGNNEIIIRMWLPAGVESSDVSTSFIYYLLPNAIIIPLPGNGFVKVPRPEISGTGVAGAQVDIHMGGDGTTVYGTATVLANNTWKVIPTRDLPQGAFQLTAKQRKDGKTRTWATAVQAFALYPLTITGPGGEQNTSFIVTGRGGLAGADVVVYLDRTDTVCGTTNVSADGSWSAAVSGLLPGVRGLTALQKQSGYTADRGSPMIFRIRPPALTAVTATLLPNQQVRLSGNGFNGATVEFTYVSGPGSQPVPPATVADGTWQTTVTNWTPGSYTFSVTQKVSDGAGGWITSLPYQFTFTWAMPDPADVTYCVADYTPTFSGNGYTGATVLIKKQGGAEAAPDATVVNGRWSSKSAQVWGPTLEQKVHLKQRLGGQESANWVEISVTITPLAPVITSLVDNEMSPTLSGTCWPGAEVNLVFSDNATVNRAVVTDGTWTYRRSMPFAADVVHTVTVTQTAATLKSPPTQRTFSVFRTLHQPVITPPPAPEVGRDLTVRGTQGVAGATMQLRDAQFQLPLGPAKPLTRDGDWDIALVGLEFREYTIDAQQTLGGQASVRSAMHTFKVVVLPPDIQVPAPGGELPRTATISGTGMPGAAVDVWLQGQAQPVLSGLPVRSDGHWEGNVTLDIGHQTLWATQIFDNKLSRNSTPQTVRVVPAAPYIETPAANELVGRRTVVSGFGYPGDRVAVSFAHAPLEELARGLVLDDRTWSVVVNLTHSSGSTALIAVQWREAFNSGASARREIQLGTYLPGITAPAPGQWVTHPVGFAGTGLSGSGSVSSWFNPDLKWQVNIGVPGGRWQGSANTPLPQGGNWVRFQQTIVDSPRPTTPSDSVESERFEVAQGDRP